VKFQNVEIKLSNSCGVVLMCCICIGFSHSLSLSRFDPKLSHMQYVTPDTVTMSVWLRYTIHLTLCLACQGARSDYGWFFCHQKNLTKICTKQRSLLQTLFDEKSLGFWPNTQPTNPSCMSGKANTSTPCGILQLFFWRIISTWTWPWWWWLLFYFKTFY